MVPLTLTFSHIIKYVRTFGWRVLDLVTWWNVTIFLNNFLQRPSLKCNPSFPKSNPCPSFSERRLSQTSAPQQSSKTSIFQHIYHLPSSFHKFSNLLNWLMSWLMMLQIIGRSSFQTIVTYRKSSSWFIVCRFLIFHRLFRQLPFSLYNHRS